MAVELRPARADDLQRAQELIVGSINDLTARHGFGAIASVRPAAFQQFTFEHDPAGFWVAEDQNEIVGTAFSWTAGQLWLLAELFIAPGMQGSGLGRELLQRALAHAADAGASTKALITFSFNTVSQGLYVRHGLFPRLPVYMFTAKRTALGDVAGAALELREADRSGSDRAQFDRLDEMVLGVGRKRHHEYLFNDPTTTGFLLSQDGDCVGYAYVATTGQVGPVAVTRPDLMAPAFQAALKEAAAGASDQVSAFLPGNNEATLAVAAGHGMRITLPMVLLSNREFGDWTCYLARNPGFL